MPDLHAAAFKALEVVADALRDAQDALLAAEIATRNGLRLKDDGVPIAAALRAHPVHESRKALDDSLYRLERARHAILIEVFRVALADGMSIGELARNYGFSRQLASRYAKEARGNG
jgi:hypothetical protein